MHRTQNIPTPHPTKKKKKKTGPHRNLRASPPLQPPEFPDFPTLRAIKFFCPPRLKV